MSLRSSNYTFSYHQAGTNEFVDAAGHGETTSSSSTVSDFRPICAHASFTIVDKVVSQPEVMMSCFVEGGAQAGIGSQIAVRLALDTMIETVAALGGEGYGTTELVQRAFKEANSRVHAYGRQMLAAAQIAATAVVSTFDGEHCTVARVGPYDCFLLRDGVVHPFFEDIDPRIEQMETGETQRFIGAKPQVLVDIATVDTAVGDVVVISSLPPNERIRAATQSAVSMQQLGDATARSVLRVGLDSSIATSGDKVSLHTNGFLSLLSVEGLVIRLEQVVQGG